MKSMKLIQGRGAPALADALLSAGHDEAGASVTLLCWLMFGDLAKMMGKTRIVSHVWEFRLRGARADLVTFHEDSSITIFEINGPSCAISDAASGIGQLFLYSALMPSALGYAPLKVELCLAAPCSNEEDAQTLHDTCRLASVDYLRLPSSEVVRDIANKKLVEEAA